MAVQALSWNKGSLGSLSALESLESRCDSNNTDKSVSNGSLLFSECTAFEPHLRLDAISWSNDSCIRKPLPGMKAPLVALQKHLR